MIHDDLRYPIGPFRQSSSFSSESRESAIVEIRDTPVRLGNAVSGLTEAQVDRPYRPGGWSRTVQHPEWGVVSVDALVERWAWHGKHHAAQIIDLRSRNGW